MLLFVDIFFQLAIQYLPVLLFQLIFHSISSQTTSISEVVSKASAVSVSLCNTLVTFLSASVARIDHLGVRNRALCNDLKLIWVKNFKLIGIVLDNYVNKMLEKNFKQIARYR